MCVFCDEIYTEEEETQLFNHTGKFADIPVADIPDAFIVKEEDDSFCITACSGDPYDAGYVCNIKYCPYCGRRL